MRITQTGAHTVPWFRCIVMSLLVILSFPAFGLYAQDGTITLSGTVISSVDNQPIVGVAVYVEGSSTGATTDLDGTYSITVPADTKEITFACVGYLTRQIKLDESNIVFKVVSMDESTQFLEDAVVVAFGTTQRKETMITSVETVSPGLLKTPSSNLSTTFAGNIAGVISTQSSGEPGADGANFWIRGVSTFGASTEPLYILDGVEINKEMLNGISPESIESFSVLKDAAATALYGTRGANGVMIITTKSGRVADKMTINVNFNTTVTMPTAIPAVADGVTYMKNYNEARTGRGSVAYFSDDKIAGTEQGLNPYVYPNVNWYDMLFRDFGLSENLNVNVRGGGNRVDYFLNAAVYNEDGMIRNSPDAPFKTNINAQKYTFQSNVTAKITNTTTASIKMNAQLLYKYLPNPTSSNLFYWSMRANPVQFAPTYPTEWVDGATYTIFGNTASWDGKATDINPYAELSRGYGYTYTNYTTVSLNLNQDLKFITPGLKIWGQVSFYNKTYSSRYYFKTPHYYTLSSYEYDDVTQSYICNLAQIGAEGTDFLSTKTGKNGLRQLLLQGNLEYNRTFGKHNVGAVFVYHQKETVDNQPSDYYAMLPKREQGIAGRVSYAFDDRYLAEVNFGYNGSENFISGQRFGLLPSAAVGWIVSNDNFWSGIKDWFSFLKFRYSFGYSGNDYLDQRFPYVSEVQMGYLLYYSLGINYDRKTGNKITTVGNEDATWEVSRKHNLGVELGFFDDLTIIADFYQEYRDGIFMRRNTLPSTMGLSGIEPYGNLGAVLNRGMEISADYKHVFSKDFSITARGTFTYAHNEVVENDESLYKQYPYTSKIGKPVNSIFGLVADGLFRDEADIANSPRQTYMPDYMLGDIKYKDLNGDGVVDDNDRTYIGFPTVPEILYGFGASFYWKNLDFSFFFQGRARVSILMEDMHPFRDNETQGFNMQQWIADDHWSESNPDVNAAYPRLDYEFNANNTETSTFWVKDGSFLRLKNLEVGYTVKDFFRIYCAATNLFIISPFKYWDAEKGSGNGLTYPLQRTVQLGLQFNF